MYLTLATCLTVIEGDVSGHCIVWSLGYMYMKGIAGVLRW
jgi:hypothetical protein